MTRVTSTGAPNTNNSGYAIAYRHFAKLAFKVIEAQPASYGRYVLKNLKAYLALRMVENLPPEAC